MNRHLEEFMNAVKDEILKDFLSLAKHMGAVAEPAISVDVSVQDGELTFAVEIGGIRLVRVHRHFWIGEELSEREVDRFASLECAHFVVDLLGMLPTASPAA